MSITKYELNNIHLVRELRAEHIVDELKKMLIRDISIDITSKTKTYVYTFELGQDLLIQKIIERVNHEFIDMVETNVIVHYEPDDDRNRMTLRIKLNWQMDLNQAFIVYDESSSDEEQS